MVLGQVDCFIQCEALGSQMQYLRLLYGYNKTNAKQIFKNYNNRMKLGIERVQACTR